MTVPTIHLNGTSKVRLLDDTQESYQAVCLALDTLIQRGPNARDYYPQGPDVFRRAVEEHQARVDRLQSVCVELAALAEAICDGGVK